MELFQALLLAVSLGWTSVLAEPSHSASAPNTTTSHHGLEATFKTLVPHTMSTAPPLSAVPYPVSGTMTAYSPVTMQSAASLSDHVYASPVSIVTGNSLDAPGSRLGQHQQVPSARPDRQHHSPSEKQLGSTCQSGTSGPPLVSAVVGETYYVHGQPVVAGASPTVIAGTTYSVGQSGDRVWVDGKPTSAVGVASTPAALATSSYVPAAATGGGMALAVPRMLLGIVCGIVAAL